MPVNSGKNQSGTRLWGHSVRQEFVVGHRSGRSQRHNGIPHSSVAEVFAKQAKRISWAEVETVDNVH